MKVSPDAELTIIKAILAIEPAETAQTLRSEGALAIRKTLGCSGEHAAVILQGLEKHELIKIGISPLDGALEGRQVPKLRLRWRAPTSAEAQANK
jgi:hypothetical protein